MQTFLPYRDFRQCARVLDLKRLGKQRVECLQIMTVLVEGRSKGWANHPAVKMWQGYEYTLMEYTRAMCERWRSLGYIDNCENKTELLFLTLPLDRGRPGPPPWLGLKKLHSSHRANLVRKDPARYGRLFSEAPMEGYWWPTKEGYSSIGD